MALILCVSALSVVPGVEAAAEAVGGVSAHVTTSGDPAIVVVSWFVSSDDPDQDAGDWTYNVTVDAGSGWVQVVTDGTVTDGVGQEVIQFGGSTFSGTYNVTADDGTGPVDSCLVTVDTGVDLDFDACGTMDADNTYQEYYCLETGDDETGFTFVRPLGASSGTTVINEDEILFKASTSGTVERLAVGALVLGGDIRAVRLDTEFRFRADSLSGHMRLFFSTVDTPVGEISFGDGYTTGAFADGVGFEFREALNNIHVRVYRVNGGGLQNVYEEFNWITGTANDFNDLQVTFHPESETITLVFGPNEITVSDTNPDASFESLWITEGWSQGLSGSVVTGGDGFCLSSSVDNPLVPGTAEGQALPGFEGGGGFGGPPMFPGVDVEESADSLGLDVAAFAWILAMVAFIGFAFLGFLAAKLVGAGLGGICGVVVAVAFNLLPLWLVVLLFLAAVAIIVLGIGGRR